MCIWLQIVNLVSNDVRRFDDAMPFWCFLWGGPLELAIVLLLLSLELGAAAAFAGVASMLLVIPVQVPPHALPLPSVGGCIHPHRQKCRGRLTSLLVGLLLRATKSLLVAFQQEQSNLPRVSRWSSSCACVGGAWLGSPRVNAHSAMSYHQGVVLPFVAGHAGVVHRAAAHQHGQVHGRARAAGWRGHCWLPCCQNARSAPGTPPHLFPCSATRALCHALQALRFH